MVNKGARNIGGEMSKYKYQSEPTCPWCDYKIEDAWDYSSLRGDEDKTEAECPKCDKKIEITLHVSYEYSTRAMGCPKHKLELQEYYKFLAPDNYIEFTCTECKEDFYDWQLEGGKHQRVTSEQYEFVGDALPHAIKRNLIKSVSGAGEK